MNAKNFGAGAHRSRPLVCIMVMIALLAAEDICKAASALASRVEENKELQTQLLHRSLSDYARLHFFVLK